MRSRGGGERGPAPHAAATTRNGRRSSLMTAIIVTPLALLGGVFYAARTLDEP
jgi:hypothetical protein